MAKAKKSEWQLEVRNALDILGLTYAELAEAVGTKEGYVRQLMCGTWNIISDKSPTKQKITEYLKRELENIC
jgi:transcriptional regulator with XRE-family HTH domain